MNRYPVWKYIVIGIVLLFGMLYSAPNYFGETPALQITSGKATGRVGPELLTRVEQTLKAEHFTPQSVELDGAGVRASVRARFKDTDTQFKAKAALEADLNRGQEKGDEAYIVTLNLLPNTPKWMQSIRALPMYLGLDLRGGVHFLMQVDVKAALTKRVMGIQASVRTTLKDKDIRHAGIERKDDIISVKFLDAETRSKARDVLSQNPDLQLVDAGAGDELRLQITLKASAFKKTIDDGVQQNIATLSKRVNELGVAEPVIQQQGADRIVVQLPGVQDVARAKAVIGRTATLEVRMVDETVVQGTELSATVPYNSELFTVGKSVPVVLYKDIVLTGDYISSATATFDQNHQPAVSIDLNGDGGRKMREATRERVGKKMAIVLYEKGKPKTRPNWPCCCAPAPCTPRWTSSRNAPLAPAWARKTSKRVSTRRCTALPPFRSS